MSGGLAMKDKHKNQVNKEIEDLEYEMLGNLFIGNLLDMSGDLDNSSQNLITYLELEEINKAKTNFKNKH